MTERRNDVIHQFQQLPTHEQDELADREQWATFFAPTTGPAGRPCG